MKDQQASYPQLRFKGCTDPWEKLRLGDISEKVTEKNSDNEFSETLTNSAEYGIISQRDFFDKDISNEKNLNTYYVVRDGDFVYNPRISNFAPVGPIKRNTLGRTGVMSPLYYIFRAHNVDGMYLEKYFSSTKWHRFMELNGDTGARADRFAIKDKDFVQMPIPLPNLEEQSKIARFLENVDNLIAANQRKLDLLKEQKKGYLQKMFPKNGAKVPELRFAGFADAWEQRKFSNLVKKVGKHPSVPGDYTAYSVSNVDGLIPQTQQFDGSRLDVLDKSAYKVVNPGEFAYNPARINVGSVAYNDLEFPVLVSSLYVVVRMDQAIDDEFILQFIRSPQFLKEVRRNTEGSVREYLFFDNFKNVRFPFALNIEEQQKVGSFLRTMDDTIALHQRKLEKLQELKKGYLQKMFC